MNKKKFKILAIVDVVIIVALLALMMTLKGQYNEQAQNSVKSQVDAYREKTNGVLQEEWLSIDQYSMAWRLVFLTLNSDKKQSTFINTARNMGYQSDIRTNQMTYIYTAAGIPAKAQQAIFEKAGLSKEPLLINERGNVIEVNCGKDCKISFTFKGGKLESMDYKALAEYNFADHFKLEAPAPFHFE